MPDRGQTEVSESCFFSSQFFQHAINGAEHMVCVVLIWGKISFLSPWGRVEVPGTSVTWEGIAHQRTRWRTERAETGRGSSLCPLTPGHVYGQP